MIKIEMKFCKKCHKRVTKVAFTSKDLYNTCLCGDGYLETGSSEVRGILGNTTQQEG